MLKIEENLNDNINEIYTMSQHLSLEICIHFELLTNMQNIYNEMKTEKVNSNF